MSTKPDGVFCHDDDDARNDGAVLSSPSMQ